MLRCAQSPRSNVLIKYASARRFFARLASEIFFEQPANKVSQQPAKLSITFGLEGSRSSHTKERAGEAFSCLWTLPCGDALQKYPAKSADECRFRCSRSFCQKTG